MLLLNAVKFFENDSFVTTHQPSQSKVDYLVERFSHIHLVLMEGHILFNHPPFYNLCNLRYFLTLDEKECRHRRRFRNYDPPNPPGFFDKVVWPAYLERLNDVKSLPRIQYYDAGATPLLDIYHDILACVTNKLEAVSKQYKNEIPAVKTSEGE